MAFLPHFYHSFPTFFPQGGLSFFFGTLFFRNFENGIRKTASLFFIFYTFVILEQ